MFETIVSSVDGIKVPPGRTLSEAIAVARKHRDLIWTGEAGRGLDEDQKIDLLRKICGDMLGDVESGKKLASRAIWP